MATRLPFPKAPLSCAPRWKQAFKVPKLCASDMVDAFGSCRLCLVEIEGRNGTPASCTTPAMEGLVVRTQTQASEGHSQRRDGTLYFRPSARLPDLRCQWRLRVAGHGGCAWACAMCAMAMRATTTFSPRPRAVANDRWMPKDECNPYFTYDPAKCIVCSLLCPRLRGSAGHVRTDDRGPRLLPAALSPGMPAKAFIDSECVSCGACVQACPTATLTREVGHPDRPARALQGHHLRLLWRGLLVQGGNARRGTRAHGALQGWQGQSRPSPASRAALPMVIPPTRIASSTR